tara:strand:- start:349 stop:687 length:339 start_codon:yes stop_codon:yes gene_type:complete
MTTQNLSTMENEIKSREVPKIEISYINKQELKELSKKKEFIEYILEISLSSIEEAINKKWKKVELCDIINLSLLVILKRENFESVLTRISKFYERMEEYEMCAKIKKLKKKI